MLILSWQNIHIWSFKPSRLSKNEDSVWTCLYDTQTNGTSIQQLYFRHNAHGTLQGISKSDDQKLRVWDLGYEQKRIAQGTDGSDRPKRPDYVDVASTEGTIGVCGPYAFASGSLGGMHNIINVVGLDADDVSSPFNCTELALPVDTGSEHHLMHSRPSRTGRQQRGDLKSVEHVAGLVFDASHALLQLSDGSVVHYLHDQSGHPLLLQSPPSLCTTCIDDEASFGGFPVGPNQNKKMSLARVGSQGMVLFAVSSFNENTSRGAIMLRALPGINDGNVSKSFRRYWGFNGLKRKRKQSVGLAVDSSTPLPVSKSNNKVMHSALKVHQGDVTPAAVSAIAKSDKSSHHGMNRPSQTDVDNYTPVPMPNRTNQTVPAGRKVTPGDSLTPAPSKPTTAKADKSCPKKKRSSEDDQMDSQLESIVHSVTTHSPMPMKKQKMAAPKEGKQYMAVDQSVEKTPLPSSPKRRGGRKKTTPRSTPVKKAEPENKRSKKVGFLGVTILDQRPTPSLPESCYQPRQRPTLLVEQLPYSTVESRVNAPAFHSFEKGVGESPHFQKHCNERQTLAAKHRAEHEMVRKKVLHSIRYVLSTWDIELNSNKTYSSIVESAKQWFDEALQGHQEMLVS